MRTPPSPSRPRACAAPARRPSPATRTCTRRRWSRRSSSQPTQVPHASATAQARPTRCPPATTTSAHRTRRITASDPTKRLYAFHAEVPAAAPLRPCCRPNSTMPTTMAASRLGQGSPNSSGAHASPESPTANATVPASPSTAGRTAVEPGPPGREDRARGLGRQADQGTEDGEHRPPEHEERCVGRRVEDPRSQHQHHVAGDTARPRRGQHGYQGPGASRTTRSRTREAILGGDPVDTDGGQARPFGRPSLAPLRAPARFFAGLVRLSPGT